MGRSISYPAGAQVCYTTLDIDGDGDLAFDCLVEDIAQRASEAFPSLVRHDGWRGREDRILLRNAYTDLGVSSLGDLVAIWIVERDDGAYHDCYTERPRYARARHWLDQVSPSFDALFGDLICIGRFSDGTSIYRRSQQA